MSNKINVIAQAFYGNRVETRIPKDNVDGLILGYTGNDIKITEPIDRTIIRIPNDENLVIVYNKYHEEEAREDIKNMRYTNKPLAVIPELNIELYGRCIACRMNADGELESIQRGDYNKITKYFAE